MASAEQQLQDLIASVRAEAKAEGDAEGYARAWQEVRQAANVALGLGPELKRVKTIDLLFRARDTGAMPVTESVLPPIVSADEARQRRRRGQNRDLVKMVLGLVDKQMGATEIQRHLQAEGVAYSSVRHALDQLKKAGDVIEHPGGLFELKSNAAPSDSEEAA